MSPTNWALIYFFSFQLDIRIPVRRDRECNNNFDRFYYICGYVVLRNRRAKITDFLRKAYRDYIMIKLGDQNKPCAPLVCCKTYVGNLRDWRNSKRKTMIFVLSLIWRKGNYHITVYYFYMINLKGINCQNKQHVQYADVPSAIGPIPHIQTFLILSKMVIWSRALIPNLVS